MTKKIKVLIAAGGTGGQVFPAYRLAKDLIEKKNKVELITDLRGYNLLKNYKELKLKKISSSPIIKKNILTIFSSIILILFFKRVFLKFSGFPIPEKITYLFDLFDCLKFLTFK